MANIKDFIKNLDKSDLSVDEQLNLLSNVEQTIKEQKLKEQNEKRKQEVEKNVDFVIAALKKIESKLEAKLEELNKTPARVGAEGPKGKDGKDGKNGKDGLNGRDGINGKNGIDGQNGLDGKDGISVVDAKVDFDGSLVIYLSNGSEIDTGKVLSEETASQVIINSGGSGTSQAVSDAIASIQQQISFLSPNTSITSWVYSGVSKSITADETVPTGLFFKSDGTAMYIAGDTGNDITQYTLSTAWDVSTAGSPVTFSVTAQESSIQDVFFSPDGLSMYIVGIGNDTVYQYTLGTAWSVTTASYASKSFSVASQETSPTGIWFKPDGTTMYLIGTLTDTVFQYTLSTAWDVSTASYASISFSVAAQESNPNALVLSHDGLKLWVLGFIGDDIWEYNLGTAWDVSTATPVNNFYIGFQETGPVGLFIDSTAPNRVYVVGSTSDTVFQYNTVTSSVTATTDKFYVEGGASVNGNFVAGSNAYVDGTLTVQGNQTFSGSTTVLGSLAASSTINLAGTGTSTTTLGTAASTGIIVIGGTAQTGAITVGQSTAAQTLNLATGATANATTKVVNIGTAGVSGSTTNINIGSAVSGSLGATTITAPTVNLNTVVGTSFKLQDDTSGTPTASTVWVTGTKSGLGRTSIKSSAALWFSSASANNIQFNTNSSSTVGNDGSAQFAISNTTSAVNFVQVTGSPTGGFNIISSQGSDTNIPMGFYSKGTGGFTFRTGGGTNRAFEIVDVASSVNRLQVRGSATGVAPAVFVDGTDTNIDLALTPKGTGLVRFGTYTAGAPTATGYINIKAADGTTYKVLVST